MFKRTILSREALTKVQAAIIVVVILVAAIGIVYYLNLPKPEMPPIKIGVHGPMTGPAALWGLNIKVGTILALRKLEREGGLLGRRVEIIWGDDQSKPEVGVSVFEKFATQDKVDFIVGGVHSSVELATMDVAAKYGIIDIITIAASDDIENKIMSNPGKYRCVFRTNCNVSSFALCEIQFLSDLIDRGYWKPRNNKMAILVEDTDWGRAVGKKWKDYWEARGWNIVVYETFELGLTDFYPLLTRIKSADPCVLKSESTSIPAGAALVNQLYEFGLQSTLLHIDGDYAHIPEKSKWLEMTSKDASQYLLCKYMPRPPEWFIAESKAESPDVDPAGAMKQYDAMNILFEAIKKAGSLDKDKIIQILETETFVGLWGTYKFRESHGTYAGPKWITHYEMQIIDGEWYYIWPFDKAEKTFVPPPGSQS